MLVSGTGFYFTIVLQINDTFNGFSTGNVRQFAKAQLLLNLVKSERFDTQKSFFDGSPFKGIPQFATGDWLLLTGWQIAPTTTAFLHSNAVTFFQLSLELGNVSTCPNGFQNCLSQLFFFCFNLKSVQ